MWRELEGCDSEVWREGEGCDSEVWREWEGCDSEVCGGRGRGVIVRCVEGGGGV